MMQTQGIPAGQMKWSGCVKSQTCQGAVTKYTSNLVASHKPDTRSLHQKLAAG